MQNRKIKSQIQAFDSLVARAISACGESVEMRAEWSRYLCVVAAGILENAIKELYGDFATNKVSAPLARFVGSSLSPIRSPRTQKFLEVAGAFNKEWADELSAFVQHEGGQEAIDSIMLQRHLIAHGRYKESRISMAQIQDYFARAVRVLELIEKQCSR